MEDFSSYVDRDLFNEKIYDSINEHLNLTIADLDNEILAINIKTFEIQICNFKDVDNKWDSYKLKSLIRSKENGVGIEVDIDETFEIANKYYFVR